MSDSIPSLLGPLLAGAIHTQSQVARSVDQIRREILSTHGPRPLQIRSSGPVSPRRRIRRPDWIESGSARPRYAWRSMRASPTVQARAQPQPWVGHPAITLASKMLLSALTISCSWWQVILLLESPAPMFVAPARMSYPIPRPSSMLRRAIAVRGGDRTWEKSQSRRYGSAVQNSDVWGTSSGKTMGNASPLSSVGAQTELIALADWMRASDQNLRVFHASCVLRLSLWS